MTTINNDQVEGNQGASIRGARTNFYYLDIIRLVRNRQAP